jgi:AcrR family transcriptional regulator
MSSDRAARVTPDGRAARRDRNKLAVLDAVIELFSEGHLDPDPDTVAVRCGLSPRSVYRYFEDRDGLLRAAIARHLEGVWPLYVIHAIGEGELDDRIHRFVDARIRLYEAIASTSRAARSRASANPIIGEQVELTRRALREQVDRHFATELGALDARRRRAVATAVDDLCQLESLDYYRMHRGFSVRTTRQALVDALGLLFGTSPDAGDVATMSGESRGTDG